MEGLLLALGQQSAHHDLVGRKRPLVPALTALAPAGAERNRSPAKLYTGPPASVVRSHLPPSAMATNGTSSTGLPEGVDPLAIWDLIPRVHIDDSFGAILLGTFLGLTYVPHLGVPPFSRHHPCAHAPRFAAGSLA